MSTTTIVTHPFRQHKKESQHLKQYDGSLSTKTKFFYNNKKKKRMNDAKKIASLIPLNDTKLARVCLESDG